MSAEGPTVHASAVMVGDRAVLIRGPSGAGKSRLAFELILAGRTGMIPPAVLVGDDRVHLARVGEEIEVRPAAALAGLIEIRGLGIRRCDFVPHATLGLVVDLAAEDGERLPPPAALSTLISGLAIPRVPVPPGFQALQLIAAALITTKSSCSVNGYGNCQKGIGNHMRPTIATD